MIDHLSNGFVARFKDSESLAEGIQWILNKSTDYEELSRKCIKKVHAHYAQGHVALRYIELYEQELSFKEKLK